MLGGILLAFRPIERYGKHKSAGAGSARTLYLLPIHEMHGVGAPPSNPPQSEARVSGSASGQHGEQRELCGHLGGGFNFCP